jgi:molybdopterin/thiamine biosynthesis adenylyltransferase
MSRLVFPSPLLSSLRASLLKSELETCAVGYGHACSVDGALARIVVREIQEVPEDAYLRRTTIAAVLSPEFVAQVSKRAKISGASVVFIHTHPFELNEFSPTDDHGESELRLFFSRRTPGVPHATLLLTPSSSIARLLGTATSLSVSEIGETFTIITGEEGNVSAAFDRQVRVFGSHGQKMLQSLHVGIIGLGGTGSVVAQQLAHLGLGHFTLIDDDRLEDTNLNRVVGTTPGNLGHLKIDVTADMILRINPSAVIERIPKTILGTKTLRNLARVDVAFCCTDSHGSRSVINQVAYQFLVPVLDVGVVIDAPGGIIKNIIGRVQMLSPGLSCLVCDNILDAEQIRRDLMSEAERKRDPYIVGSTERQPAVISLNSTVSSFAVTMLLEAAVGVPGSTRRIHYNAIAGTVRAVRGLPHPTCVICSSSGCLARGDSIPLFARDDW